MFLDFGLGILTSLFFGWLLDFKPDWFFILGGVLFSVLPDVDYIYWLIRKSLDKNYKKYFHRNYIHYPLIYLPVGTLLFYFLGGEKWELLFFVCSSLHFFHDSIGLGWGVRWLYPFNSNNFAFFFLLSGKQKGGLKKLIFNIDEELLEKYEAEHGIPDWFSRIYLKMHPLAVIEFIFFVISIIILIYAR